MSTISLSNLGTMVRNKRGDAKLRETAQDIEISAATLMRVESGRIPDVETFGKLCTWLNVDPAQFLGFKKDAAQKSRNENVMTIGAHFRADKTPKPATVNALAKMILIAMNSQGDNEARLLDENT
ncbi:MAG: helix-turn-helix domain-containing protein [Pyrinomonadaceae bacterium]|jgi:transcriptional regulator with XRE-family HTH domain